MPIVEPEVTLGEGDYSIEETAFWSERVYSHVMRLLNEYSVMLDCILLKPNMCLPGALHLLATCSRARWSLSRLHRLRVAGLDAPPASPQDVAKYTVRTMLRSIPAAVPGIHFLSGGMSEEESTLNLQVLRRCVRDSRFNGDFCVSGDELGACFDVYCHGHCEMDIKPREELSDARAVCAMQALQDECPDAPWSLTFSYGRALQSTTLKVRR